MLTYVPLQGKLATAVYKLKAKEGEVDRGSSIIKQAPLVGIKHRQVLWVLSR